MTNEQYLIVSYFVVGMISLGLALTTYLYLRRSFAGVIQNLPYKHLLQILQKLFLVGIILPALFGFFSVSFRSCSKDTYEEIIAERTYLVARNQEQLSNSLSYIAIAVSVWGIIIGSAIYLIRNAKNRK